MDENTMKCEVLDFCPVWDCLEMRKGQKECCHHNNTKIKCSRCHTYLDWCAIKKCGQIKTDSIGINADINLSGFLVFEREYYLCHKHKDALIKYIEGLV